MLRKEIVAIDAASQAKAGDNARVRDALEKNLEIKRELERTLDKNAENREALDHEIESLESLLELLLQKSVAATDAAAFSAEIDDVLHQIQSDAQSVEEMERMIGACPARRAGSAAPASPVSVGRQAEQDDRRRRAATRPDARPRC